LPIRSSQKAENCVSEAPGFTFFANHPTMIDPTYRRYLENRMRERFDLTGTPVILKFKAKT
jgi:GTP-binding protein